MDDKTAYLGARYIFDDGDGRTDVKRAEEFRNMRNGWTAEYDVTSNEWHVTTPYTHTVRRYVAL